MKKMTDIPFESKVKDLTTTLARQIQKEKVLDWQLKEQLADIGFKLYRALALGTPFTFTDLKL